MAAAAVLVAAPAHAVAQAPPTLTTSAASAKVGQPIFDLATMTGGVNPTGRVTFNLYGPGDATCTAPPIFTSTNTLDTGHSNPGAASGLFLQTTAPGSYRWRASYSGDANNAGTPFSPCNEPGETSVVSQATPSLTTIATNATLGQPIRDTATLTGHFNATGTIVFRLYGASDDTCTGPEIFTSPASVGAAGSATSGDFTPPAVGSYRWRAEYSGDANNAPAPLAACNASRETSAVTEPSVTPEPPASLPELPGVPALLPQVPGLPATPPAPPTKSPEEGLTNCAATVVVDTDGTVKLCDAANPPTVGTSQTLSGTLPAEAGATAARRKRKKRAVLGKGQTTIPAGQSRPVVIRLGAKAKRVLAKRGRLAVVAVIQAEGADGKTATVNRTVALRAGEKKRTRRRGGR